MDPRQTVYHIATIAVCYANGLGLPVLPTLRGSKLLRTLASADAERVYQVGRPRAPADRILDAMRCHPGLGRSVEYLAGLSTPSAAALRDLLWRRFATLHLEAEIVVRAPLSLTLHTVRDALDTLIRHSKVDFSVDLWRLAAVRAMTRLPGQNESAFANVLSEEVVWIASRRDAERMVPPARLSQPCGASWALELHVDQSCQGPFRARRSRFVGSPD